MSKGFILHDFLSLDSYSVCSLYNACTLKISSIYLGVYYLFLLGAQHLQRWKLRIDSDTCIFSLRKGDLRKAINVGTRGSYVVKLEWIIKR